MTQKDMQKQALWQESFASALSDLQSVPPSCLISRHGSDPWARFSVYRNNVYSSLVNILCEGFPVVMQLVGTEFFKAMASAYARTHLPKSPIMYFYGQQFGAFIDTFEPTAELPYLGDIARLEYARQIALHADDTPLLSSDDISVLDPDMLTQMQPQLHSSVQLISSAYPIYAIWARNSYKTNHPIPLDSQDALVWRQHMDVKTTALPIGGAAFFSVALKGASLDVACEAALDAGGDLKILMPLCLQLSTCLKEDMSNV